MTHYVDLTDLSWITELDREPVMTLDPKESHTTLWVHFICTFKELRDKLESIGYGLGCIDINMAKEGYDWHELESLEEFNAEFMGVNYEYRFILDTVSKS